VSSVAWSGVAAVAVVAFLIGVSFGQWWETRSRILWTGSCLGAVSSTTPCGPATSAGVGGSPVLCLVLNAEKGNGISLELVSVYSV
jgi:hypothetical protein